MLLLPPGTRTLAPGEKTGYVLTTDGPVVPSAPNMPQGYMFGWYTGIYIMVPGPDNLPQGSYDIVAKGGSKPAVATFMLRMPLGPDDPSINQTSVIGGQANGTLFFADDTWLSPAEYDLVAQ